MSRRSRLLDVADAGKKALKELLSSGVQQVRVVLRALVLRELGEGRTAAEVAALVGLTGKTVRALARRYLNGGLERALYEKARPGKKRLLDASTGQRIVAMVCGAPPAGRARWSVRLIVEQAVKRKITPQLGRETLRVLLESHELKPCLWKIPRRLMCGGGIVLTVLRDMQEFRLRADSTVGIYEASAAPPSLVRGGLGGHTTRDGYGCSGGHYVQLPGWGYLAGGTNGGGEAQRGNAHVHHCDHRDERTVAGG